MDLNEIYELFQCVGQIHDIHTNSSNNFDIEFKTTTDDRFNCASGFLNFFLHIFMTVFSIFFGLFMASINVENSLDNLRKCSGKIISIGKSDWPHIF